MLAAVLETSDLFLTGVQYRQKTGDQDIPRLTKQRGPALLWSKRIVRWEEWGMGRSRPWSTNQHLPVPREP